MNRLLIHLVVFLGSAAVGVLAAAAILDDFSISPSAYIIDVAIFAGLQWALSRLIPRHAVLSAVGLVSTFVALLLTNLFSDGLKIKGLGTWIWATLIIWVVTMLATWALSVWFTRRPTSSRRSR